MKKAIVILVSILSITACRKGDDPDLRISTFTAKINGHNFKADQITSYAFNNDLHIEGMEKQETLSMIIPGYTGPGRYTISVTGCRASYKENNTQLPAEAGTIIILSEEKDMLKGKFNFTVLATGNTKKIEEGNFNILK